MPVAIHLCSYVKDVHLICEKREKEKGCVVRFLNTIWADGVGFAGDTILMSIAAGISAADTAAGVNWATLFCG